ncbi:MAG: peptidoglycan-binding domain-containing protein [Candidatus Omnitrophica bacterium]|nr:peptidoglycan-binding domain-containing protein [Candidatus Omnitrophota bacterium]
MAKLLTVAAVLFGLLGCASVRKETRDAQIQQLQTQVSDLSGELQKKDEEIGYLERQLAAAQTQREEITSARERAPKKSLDSKKRTRKNIQLALKKAGYYKGEIDGKLGKATKKAVRDFQKANGLSADGIVGKATWAKLSGHL